jgi:hypothetical protein
MEQIFTKFFTTHISTIIYYFISSYKENIPTNSKINEENELELLQLDRLLLFMNIIFEDSFKEKYTDKHKQELYNIYKTIRSDYYQYQQWKKYNNNLLIFSSFRMKNTKELAKKILADVKLFKEVLDIFKNF